MPKRGKSIAPPAVDLLEFRRLAESEKEMLADGDWVKSPHKRSTRLTLFCGVVIDGAVAPGLRLQINALQEYPDQDVTVQLEYGTALRARIPITRCDWRPFRTHSNGALGPAELRLVDQESHWHPFDLNATEIGEAAFRPDDSLPLALPLEPEPSTFGEALVVAGRLLNIRNLSQTPVPPWQYALTTIPKMR